MPVAGVASRMEYLDGRLVFWRDGSLLTQPFDIDRGRLTGAPVTIAEHVHGFAITGFGAFSASRDALLYQAGAAAQSLEWLDRQGRPLGSIGPPADYIALELSPDESSLAYNERDQDLGTNDIGILDLRRNAARRLVNDRRTENLPIWTPDAQTILYAADRNGPPSLFARPANGTGAEWPILPPSNGGPQRASAVTPDGKFVVFVQSDAQTASDILIAPIDGSAPPMPLVRTRAREGQPALSHDGSWLVYVSDESGRGEVYVQRLRDPASRRQVTQAGGAAARWRKDGRKIFFLAPGRDHLYAASLAVTGAVMEPGIPQLLFKVSRRLADFDVTADGQRFLLAPDPPREAGAISAVLNWQALLR